MKNPILNELDDDALDTVSGGFTAEEYLEKVGFCAWRATCTNCGNRSEWETIVPTPPSGRHCQGCNAELTEFYLDPGFYLP